MENFVETQILFYFRIYSGNQVGIIIGRKGSKITQIREESACEIKVKGNDQDIERIVSVSGSPSGPFYINSQLKKAMFFYETFAHAFDFCVGGHLI